MRLHWRHRAVRSIRCEGAVVEVCACRASRVVADSEWHQSWWSRRWHRP